MSISLQAWLIDPIIVISRVIKAKYLKMKSHNEFHEIVTPQKPKIAIIPTTSRKCPKCDSGLSYKKGVRGKMAGLTFWSCDKYPSCDFNEIIAPAVPKSTTPKTV